MMIDRLEREVWAPVSTELGVQEAQYVYSVADPSTLTLD
jgi:hypothetical protein